MFSVTPPIKILFISFLLFSGIAKADAIQVVTSFSILEDLVKELGGEYVEVVNLVGRNSDAHSYQPKPSDAIALSKADLVVFNGLAFEGWIGRLIENSGFKKHRLLASEGIEKLINGQEVDPHAWQSFANIRVYIKNITEALIILKPQQRDSFQTNQKRYLAKLDALEDRLLEALADTPQDRRIVVTSHDAFAYLARELKIRFIAPQGVSLEDEASAADVANIIKQIRQQNVSALFVENISNPRILERIADEAQVTIGGHLYSDALSEIDGPANSYLTMMQHNIESLITAFNSKRL